METKQRETVLVIVDPQNDFITGSLAVPGAKEAMDGLVEFLKKFRHDYSSIIVTRDWHPANHCSFKDNGGIWPVHCLANTDGAEIYDGLKNLADYQIIDKGKESDKEEYSAFCNKIENHLNVNKRYDFHICGIAGDYCVKNSLLDLMKQFPFSRFYLLKDYIASIDSGFEVNKLEKMLDNYNKCCGYPQIITSLIDNDLYTFSVGYFVLQNYPRAEIVYEFKDRNNTVYPPGFAYALKQQLEYLRNVVITPNEIEFMKKKVNWLPDWYISTFLAGFRFNPDYVSINQDEEGHLHISITGPYYATVYFEMPILSIVSELMHFLNGDMENYDKEREKIYASGKIIKCLENGLYVGDMGTRRRFSKAHQCAVLEAMKSASDSYPEFPGKFTGSSNLMFCKMLDLQPLGTMSHQIISFSELLYNVKEVNYFMADNWSNTFDGNAGIYLIDCFTSKIFRDSLSLRLALMFRGVRIDSGDEREETELMIEKYQSLNIDPKTKQIVFSNGLNVDKAVELHKFVNGRMLDSYGIGTFFTCDLVSPDINGKNIKAMNIVIKAVEGRITEARDWSPVVKLSNDDGKEIGNEEKIRQLKIQIANKF